MKRSLSHIGVEDGGGTTCGASSGGGVDPRGRHGVHASVRRCRRSSRATAPEASRVNTRAATQPGVSPRSRADRFEGQRRSSADFLGETDEESFGPPEIAEPIDVFVLDDFADELCTVRTEPSEGVVDIINIEHHT